MVLVEPLSPNDAQRLIRTILRTGTVYYSDPHAYDRMRKHGIEAAEVVAVLRGGYVADVEPQGASWRYCVQSQARVVVIVEFESETELTVVTTWRT